MEINKMQQIDKQNYGYSTNRRQIASFRAICIILLFTAFTQNRAFPHTQSPDQDSITSRKAKDIKIKIKTLERQLANANGNYLN